MAKSEAVFEMLAVDRVDPCPHNPRTRVDRESLADLVDSIREKGVIQPVMARPMNGRYELVYGHRRLAAAKEAGLAAIPAVVKELSDEDTLEVQVIENLQREDLHPLEEADGYRKLMAARGFGADDLAVRVGKSKTYVYSRLKLADLPEKVKKMFWDGKLSPSVALLVARIPDPLLAARAAKEVCDGRYGREPMTAAEAREYIQRNFMLRLGAAQFNTSDADLVEKAGACGVCPKRTGNQASLFADIKGTDVCTDPPCFQKKQAAHWKRVEAAHAAEGGAVIGVKEAKKLFYAYGGMSHGSPYVNLDSSCWDDSKGRTYRELLKNHLPPVTLAQNPHTGRIETLIEKKALKPALKKAGVKLDRASAAPPRKTKEEKAEAARAKREREVEAAAMRIAAEALRAAPKARNKPREEKGIFEALAILAAGTDWYKASDCFSSPDGRACGFGLDAAFEAAKREVEGKDADALLDLIFRLTLYRAEDEIPGVFIRLAAERLGLDMDEITRWAREQVEAPA